MARDALGKHWEQYWHCIKSLNKLVCADISQSLKSIGQDKNIFKTSFNWVIEETLSYWRFTLANLPKNSQCNRLHKVPLGSFLYLFS